MLNRRLMILNLTTCTRCAGSPTVAGSVIKCPMDGGAILGHAQTGNCPKGILIKSDDNAPPPKTGEAWGPRMWNMLHTAKDADDRWIRSFTANVPCGPCKTGWRAILAEMPPVFGEGWFAWTVEAHNAVNVKLDKPTMTVEAARAIWLV